MIMNGPFSEHSMSSVIVCPACDLAHRTSLETTAERTRCVRCRAPLQRPVDGNLDRAVALAATALILFLMSNAYPLVVIQANGVTRATTLIEAAQAFYLQGHFALAALVFATTVIGPFLQIAGLLYLLIPLMRKRRAPIHHSVFRLLTLVRACTFVEVFMLGALVALVRLSAYAQVVPGVALWSSALLMLTLAALSNQTTPEQFWRWVESSRK
jgi:paraquat-inducible protein A